MLIDHVAGRVGMDLRRRERDHG